MDKPVRSIIEDLLPLYHEGLLSEETTQWLEEQVKGDEELQSLVAQTSRPLEKVGIESTVEHDQMMRKIKRKLSVYQLIFMAISFFLAIKTSMLNESFGFVLWYAVLGVLGYLFYKDMKIVFLISFTPIFIWSLGSNIGDYMAGHIPDMTLPSYLLSSIFGSLMTGLIHYLFAFIGSIIGLLILKIKEER